ncbi:MAG: glycosyltransferase [Elusimicrobia bacterium]|nr:glycosyltransferase [Elusimicrobiota bacterium]
MTRVLHVLGAMNQGGAETWLMHILRAIDRRRFDLQFLTHTDRPAFYDPEIRALGSKIHFCGRPGRPHEYALGFLRLLRREGPFDVVHSHVHHYSGFVLRIADRAGVPMRIAHSHNDTSGDDIWAGIARAAYLRLMKHWIRRYSTRGLAASHPAAAALFGRDWKAHPKWSVFYCAIDLAPFETEVSRAQVRAELGIPDDAFVIGHVGRFDAVKNHSFLIDVLAESVKRHPNTMALMVGKGPLRAEIEKKAQALGLDGKIRFLEGRTDIARLLKGAMDAYVFPSIYEGLPLALLEAQAAGLPCLISDTISADTDVAPSLVRRLGLDEGASGWAQAVSGLREASPTLSPDGGLKVMRGSSFDIRSSIRAIERLYQTGGT